MGKQEDHNYSQTKGSKASIFEQWLEQQNVLASEHDIKGFKHGVAHQPTPKPSDWLSKTVEATLDLLNPFSRGGSLRKTSGARTSTYAQDYTISGESNAVYSQREKASKNWLLWILVGIGSLPLIMVVLLIALMMASAILVLWLMIRALEGVLSSF